jgi:hypothetical protein
MGKPEDGVSVFVPNWPSSTREKYRKAIPARRISRAAYRWTSKMTSCVRKEKGGSIWNRAVTMRTSPDAAKIQNSTICHIFRFPAFVLRFAGAKSFSFHM